jgi:streptomycin 3"-adenylyltransferase
MGDAATGAYLHGSAVLGGLKPSSDLDVLAIVDRPTTAGERRQIVDGLLAISGRRAATGPARPVELTVVQASEVRPWRGRPTVELLYGEWLRDELQRAVPEPAQMPDLGPEIALALQGNRPLFGPPPAELLDPIPVAGLRRSVVAGVPSLVAELDTDSRNVLLTLARIWFTLETGSIRSKDHAADWGIERLPPSIGGALVRARELYLVGADIDWAAVLPEVHATAQGMLDAIDALAPRA